MPPTGDAVSAWRGGGGAVLWTLALVVATVINVVSFDLFFIAPRARSPSLMCNIC